MKDPPRLRVELRPSHLAAALIATGVIATAVLVACLPGAPWWRAAFVIAIGGYGVWLTRSRAYGATRHSIVAVELAADLRVALTERDGRRVEGIVLPDSYVGSMLTTIVLRPTGARRSRAIAIVPDMLLADEFRKLRVLLRLGHSTEKPTSPRGAFFSLHRGRAATSRGEALPVAQEGPVAGERPG